MYLCLAVLDLCCCTQAFSGYSERGILLRTTGFRRVGFGSCGARVQWLELVSSAVAGLRALGALGALGARAPLLRSAWGPPGPGWGLCPLHAQLGS